MLTQTSLSLYLAPADNCLTATEVKAELKVEHSADDNPIALKLDVAERLVEEYTNRRLMLATYDFILSRWPIEGIVLPVSPIVSVDSIKYYDGDNVEQTWASSNYFYQLNAEPCRINYVNDVPTLYESRSDAITVRFKVGYSSSATLATQQAAVPPPIKAAILKIVTDLYFNRNDGVREKLTSWQVLAYPYRVFHFPNEND